jgi:aminomethyltransferase
LSEAVHRGPTDDTQARGQPYSHDADTGDEAPAIQQLPLDAWHRARGARMVEFAGYEMPIQYEGIMAEHLWTRENAGLFDVSHMGQLVLTGENVAAALETVLPGDVQGSPKAGCATRCCWARAAASWTISWSRAGATSSMS